MRLKNYTLLFVLLLIFYTSSAQDISGENQLLKFKQFSLAEGLSQSSVICMLQDSKGFMWFGTRDGLNKYDGHNLKLTGLIIKTKKASAIVLSDLYLKIKMEIFGLAQTMD